jgi:hypothetical protein
MEEAFGEAATMAIAHEEMKIGTLFTALLLPTQVDRFET